MASLLTAVAATTAHLNIQMRTVTTFSPILMVVHHHLEGLDIIEDSVVIHKVTKSANMDHIYSGPSFK